MTKNTDKQHLDVVFDGIKNSDNCLVVNMSNEYQYSCVHQMGENVEACFDRVIEVIVDNYHSELDFNIEAALSKAQDRFDRIMRKWSQEQSESISVTPHDACKMRLQVIKETCELHETMSSSPSNKEILDIISCDISYIAPRS